MIVLYTMLAGVYIIGVFISIDDRRTGYIHDIAGPLTHSRKFKQPLARKHVLQALLWPLRLARELVIMFLVAFTFTLATLVIIISPTAASYILKLHAHLKEKLNV